MSERNTNHDEHSTEIEQVVANAVTQALQNYIPQLQAQIVQRVLAVVPSRGNQVQDNAQEGSNALVQAVSSIHAGSTQKEILRALLDAGSKYCSRIALFVVKAGAASGWQTRGFEREEAGKDFSLDLSSGPAADSYRSRMAKSTDIAEMGKAFVQHFGSPADKRILILPLVLKDKVAALVYADGGASGKLNSNSLQLLVIATSAWLEVISLRRNATPREDGEGVERPVPAAQTVSSFSDPFAAHAPKHIPVSVPAQPEPVAEVVVAASVHTASAAAPATAADPLAGLSPEDADMHRKAQRFARLLVDEIKLYNQAKVAEGRRSKDLYDRLKEDIDKSRGTFQKRYGSTAAAGVDYFQIELVRSLAEDDLSIMGDNFSR